MWFWIKPVCLKGASKVFTWSRDSNVVMDCIWDCKSNFTKTRKCFLIWVPVFLNFYQKISCGKEETLESIISEMGKLGKMWITDIISFSLMVVRLYIYTWKKKVDIHFIFYFWQVWKNVAGLSLTLAWAEHLNFLFCALSLNSQVVLNVFFLPFQNEVIFLTFR